MRVTVLDRYGYYNVLFLGRTVVWYLTIMHTDNL